MLLLCGACGVLTILLLFTRFLPRGRKVSLIFMEITAFFLLYFDRLAYIYADNPGRKAYIMVRVSNFAVFFLTSAVVFFFNLHLIDFFKTKGNGKDFPKLLNVTALLSALGMLMAIVASFTNLYYYFDSSNKYHRGDGFLLAYIIPVFCPIFQFMVIRKNKKMFSRLIYLAHILYIFVPIACGILQIFLYGISIVNMAMVLVSVGLYVFTYLDINNTVEHAHEIEIQNIVGEKSKMERLFDQTAKAMVAAVEKRDDYSKGNALKIAEYSRRIAELSGMDKVHCDQVYYAALLHDVGMVALDDKVIRSDTYSEKLEEEKAKKMSKAGQEILANISEYPYLSENAYFSHAKYDGTGFPGGSKGEEIPEIARIIAVASAFVKLTSKQRYRDAGMDFVARESFIKGAGEEFDPKFARLMVKIIDTDTRENPEDESYEEEYSCGPYREHITKGIHVDQNVRKISFDYEPSEGFTEGFSEPSIVLFDSFDNRVHSDYKTIKEYHYLEYGEVWFNGHTVSSGSKKIEVISDEPSDDRTGRFEITAGRFGDHMKLIMTGRGHKYVIVVALPDRTQETYIGMTGENCVVKNISVEATGKVLGASDIKRIVKETSYIEHMEADIKNVQIDRTRSASTDGIELERNLTITFRTMSLPSSSLVWHCPYVVLFSSDDGTVDGENYKEYSLIKINGENEVPDDSLAENKFSMEKTDSFQNWDIWKAACKRGIECEVTAERRGSKVVIKTDNLGISIENTTIIKDTPEKLYIALTGDQVALTDIRIKH